MACQCQEVQVAFVLGHQIANHLTTGITVEVFILAAFGKENIQPHVEVIVRRYEAWRPHAMRAYL
eukprot:10572-Eustigmatos_ZCMA.PRE.1